MDPDVEALLAQEPASTGRTLPIQPTRAQMVEAFELASEYKETNGVKGLEWAMVEVQGEFIDAVQIEQFHHPKTVQVDPQINYYMQSAMKEIDDYYADLNKQRLAKYQQERAEQLAKVLKALGVPFEEAARQITQTFKELSDAIITAMRPLLDLMDQTVAIQSEPLCPSHGRAMKGGLCRVCARGSMRHPRI